MDEKEYVVGRKFDMEEAVKWGNWISLAALAVATCSVVYAIGVTPAPKWVIAFALSGGLIHLVCEYFIRLLD